jgi:Bacterial Ig domain
VAPLGKEGVWLGWAPRPRIGVGVRWRSVVTLLLGVVLLALATAVSLASFHAAGGSLNLDATKDAFHPRVADVGGVPYVAWEETNGTAVQVRVARFDGTSWVAVGGSLNVDATKSARLPSIADVGGVPYVAWGEPNATAEQVLVKRFDGTSWVAVGGSLNFDPTKAADRPRITTVGGVPYVAWEETNGTAVQVRAARFDGTSWVAVGGSLNVDPTRDANFQSIANVGGVPYVAWREFDGTVEQVRVKRFDGASWVAVGGSLNFDPTKTEGDGPNIANVGGAPYVTWRETNGTAYQVRVKRFDGASWVAVGGSLNFDPAKDAQLSPSIAGVGGVPYVTWGESNGTAVQAGVKRFDGASWVAVGGSLNFDPAKDGAGPYIANVGGAPYAAWPESNGTASQIRVARDLAPSCSGESVAAAHDTATSIPLGCSDADGDVSTLTVVSGPAHGTLSAINQATRTVTYTPSPGYSGPDSFSYRANDGSLDSNTATVNLSVAAAAPPPGCPPNCPPVRPIVTRLSQSATKWRENNKLAQITKKKKPPVGTTFGFSLNEPAAVRLDFTHPASGRKVLKKCVPASKKNRKKPKCTRTVIAGTLTFNAHTGANKVRFAGRLSATKKLKPGRYTLTITATTAGLRSTPRSLSFTIVKG